MNNTYIERYNRAPKDVDVYAGERLKGRRLELGMSQKTLADMTGVTFQQIQKYERGTNRIGVSRLYDFCKTLDVMPSYFFEEVTYNNSSTASSSAYQMKDGQPYSDDTARLVAEYNKITSPEKRQLVLELIKSMHSK